MITAQHWFSQPTRYVKSWVCFDSPLDPGCAETANPLPQSLPHAIENRGFMNDSSENFSASCVHKQGGSPSLICVWVQGTVDWAFLSNLERQDGSSAKELPTYDSNSDKTPFGKPQS